jgi:beta-galactosidase
VVDFVHRDRNHPSIVLWSAGNEIGEQTRPEGVAVLKRLLDIFHREDPTRPVTTGNDNIYADNTPATKDFLNALDIVGYNTSTAGMNGGRSWPNRTGSIIRRGK